MIRKKHFWAVPSITALGLFATLGSPAHASLDGGGGNGWHGGWSGAGHGGWRDLDVYGYTAANKLIRFEDDRPQHSWTVGTVLGLIGDTALVGIDFRPATQELYGLGNAGGIYTLSTNNAIATFRSQLSVALSGTSFGVDFNPTVDRLRVVSDNGQNLRINVDTGAATVDGALNTTGVATAGVTGAAYTNNDADANTATTLYDIDTLLDQVAIQAPPNNGGLNATGKLTVDTTQDVGFDIHSRIRNGTIVETRALAALQVGGQSRLYRVELISGKATACGSFSGQHQVIGLAIPLNQP